MLWSTFAARPKWALSQRVRRICIETAGGRALPQAPRVQEILRQFFKRESTSSPLRASTAAAVTATALSI